MTSPTNGAVRSTGVELVPPGPVTVETVDWLQVPGSFGINDPPVGPPKSPTSPAPFSVPILPGPRLAISQFVIAPEALVQTTKRIGSELVLVFMALTPSRSMSSRE